MNEKVEKIKLAIDLLRQAIPENRRFDLNNICVRTDVTEQQYYKPHIYLFDVETYEEGTEFLRSLGCQRRDKHPRNDGRCTLSGSLPEMEVLVYCGTLPKTCRIVETKKLVPKTEVRTINSNEMVEVTIREVVCSGGPDEAKTEGAQE